VNKVTEIDATPVTVADGKNREGSSGTDQARPLFAWGLGLSSMLMVYYAATARVLDPLHLFLGLIIMGLALTPALVWARRGAQGMPAFEILLVMTANAFALPLLSGHTQVRTFDIGTVTNAATALIGYQVSALVTFYLTAGRPGRSPFFLEEVLNKDLARFVSGGLILSTAYTFSSSFYPSLIPYEINSVVRAIAMGIGMVTVFAESRRWGRGEMAPGEIVFFTALIAIQVLSSFATLFLVSGISLLALALIGYVSGARRLPLLTTALLFGFAALLHNGQSTMRAKYWEGDQRWVSRELKEVPSFMTEWIEAGLNPSREDEEKAMAKKLLERSSLFHILCLVVDNSPDPLPFLGGETYTYIPGQFVPRFFWPGKPHAHIATDVLCIYYGLQNEETVRSATIGFGMICEAYANFGMLGVISLGIVLGFLFRRAQLATQESPLLSYAGIFMIILTAWAFQTEANLALWITSMFQALVTVLGLPFLIRNIAQ